MKIAKTFNLIIKILLFILLPLVFFLTFQYFSKAAPTKANLLIDTRKIIGFINPNWKALAQGGEEKGVRMLGNVVDPVAALFPKFIRIDHIYDFYDVVDRDSQGNLTFNWEKLDQTVCDIYHTGAKPFFSLSYMPPTLSEDQSLIGKPKNWEEWSLLVQKTIERYSGRTTRICGGVTGTLLEDIYYEVWNEPDLETFGKWSHWGGDKDYKTLYLYSIKGANQASNVYRFLIGGPATTAAYKNWFQVFADYILKNKLRIDFISWHHYSKNPADFYQDLTNFNDWFAEKKYERFRFLPKIISEWGYDSNPNPIANSNVGAAHTIASIRNLIEQKLDLAFAFEIKDGLQPSWGILTQTGEKKPRYQALKMLNVLDRARLEVTGEGTYVKAIASSSYNKTSIVVVNFDENNQNTELVPLTITNLSPGSYQIVETRLDDKPISVKINLADSTLKKSILLPPNSVVTIEITKML